MQQNRTSVGLDVHARSVVACGFDGETGEVFERRLTPQHGEILAWIRNLPTPVAVTYEAGPTGFGLARAINEAGMECVVCRTVEVAASGRGSGQDRCPRCGASGPAAAVG